MYSNIFHFNDQSILMSDKYPLTILLNYNTKAHDCSQRRLMKRVFSKDFMEKWMNSFVPIWKPWFDSLICRRNMKSGLDFRKVQCSQEDIRSGVVCDQTSQKRVNFFLSWIWFTTALWISLYAHYSKAKYNDEILFEKHSNWGKIDD